MKKKIDMPELLERLRCFESEISKKKDNWNDLYKALQLKEGGKVEIEERKRTNWLRRNKNSIMELYPKEGKFYQIKDILQIFNATDKNYARGSLYEYGNHRKCLKKLGGWVNINGCRSYYESIGEWDSVKHGCKNFKKHLEDIYYFKATDLRFRCTAWTDVPFVTGNIYDDELEIISTLGVGNFINSDSWEDSIDTANIYINNLIEIKIENLTEDLKAEIFGETNVYVMIDKNTGYYKIGRSIKPEYREKTLQSEKPTIEILFSRRAKAKDETYLHKHFKAQRIRGEWFDLKGSDLTTIRRYFNTGSI